MPLEFVIFGFITFLLTVAQSEVTEVVAEADSQAVLPCQCSPSSSFPHAITWSKANRGTVWRKNKSGLEYWGNSWIPRGAQRVRCLHPRLLGGDCSLQINSVREEDGGRYFCRVENGHGFKHENEVILRIIRVSIFPPVILLKNDVFINCKVTPRPYEATVQWMLNNRPFIPQHGIPSNSPATQSVLWEEATTGLAGNWTCTVGYGGREGRASATLALTGIIQPSKDNTKVYAAVGSAATLPCVFSGFIPSDPAWEKVIPGSPTKPAPDQLPASFSPSVASSQSTLDQSATLREVKLEDEGVYRCSGTAGGQQLTRSLQLVVAIIDSSASTDSVTLTCRLTDTSEVTEYEWVHVTYDLNGIWSIVSKQEGETVTINRMSEASQGEWMCRFYGKEGILGNGSYHIHRMNGLSAQQSAGSSYKSIAAIALSCLLLIVLLVLVKMYKNHQRRKKIFAYPALETIIHTISNEREEREKKREKT